MSPAITDCLSKFVTEGTDPSSATEIQRWTKKVASFFRAAGLPDEASRFLGLQAEGVYDEHALRIGHLEGLLAKAQIANAVATATVATQEQEPLTAPPESNSRKVFVVHGHDSETKEVTARFLEKLGLQPIILHEQASAGRTVIEKFESYSGDIAFAVVLLTPDDVGAPVAAKEGLNPRARQNVILELGYFMGRLGRFRVCALHKGGVELPSDYQGVVYVALDPSGAWKTKLAQELVQAKLPIDLSALLSN